MPRYGSTSRGRQADESIAAPKGHGPRTPAAFSCIAALSRGPREGAIIASLDPELAAVRLEAKGLPPLGQYFSRLGNQTPFTLLD